MNEILIFRKGGRKLRELGDVEYLKISTIADNYVEKGTSFLAQHGLSLLIEVKKGKSIVKILLDTGQFSSTVCD